jgi:acyl-CoA thioesterase YciA
MELVTTYICKTSDNGVHDNIFGGTILGLIDQSAGAYAAQICDTPRMVTIKIDEFYLRTPLRLEILLSSMPQLKSLELVP